MVGKDPYAVFLAPKSALRIELQTIRDGLSSNESRIYAYGKRIHFQLPYEGVLGIA